VIRSLFKRRHTLRTWWWSAGSLTEKLQTQPEQLQAAYASVRPYGGTLHWNEAGVTMPKVDLEKAELGEADGKVQITRVGALEGAADWSHQYGDIGNTVKSDDRRVKAPLGCCGLVAIRTWMCCRVMVTGRRRWWWRGACSFKA
jgi:hypothetical protein